MSLLLVLVGCLQPAVPDIGDDTVVSSAPSGAAQVSEQDSDEEDCLVDEDDDGAYYPTTTTCSVPEGTPLDCDDGDPEMDAEACADVSAHEEQEEQYGGCTASATTTWMVFDFTGGFHADYEPEITVIFPDDTSQQSGDGAQAEVRGAYNPFTFRLEIDGHPIPPSATILNTIVSLLDEDFVEVAELRPVGLDSEGFLVYGCSEE